jgi:hypothetical protein
LVGDDERLERIRNRRRELGRPQFRDGVGGERLIAPEHAVIGGHAIVLRRMSVDGIARAELLELEVDVEELELTQESLADAAASAPTDSPGAAASRGTAAAAAPTKTATSGGSSAGRVWSSAASKSAAPAAHHASERDDRRSAEHVVGRREALLLHMLDERLSGVERDEVVVGRHALRRRCKGEELNARPVVQRDAAAAHNLIILTARRVAGVDLRR